MKIGIHIFRKDLRIYDNKALYQLYQKVDKIILVFILDILQIIKTNKNKYYISNNAIQFMCESLYDLNKQSNNNLILLYGDITNIITEIIKKYKPQYISYNNDYTNYSLKRDNIINTISKNYNINIITSDDQTLINTNKLSKNNNQPYLVFGAFYKNEIKFNVDPLVNIKLDKFYKPQTKNIFIYNFNNLNKFYTINPFIAQQGGRTNGLLKLNKQNITNFKYRDQIAISSFNISAYLNFGCISIREFYQFSKYNSDIIKQIIWRDFYICIIKYKPLLYYDKYIDSRFNKIKWPPINLNEWKSFIQYKTGFLLIDAALKELVITGYIGNRNRLLLATFWIKYLLIDMYNPKYGAYYGFSKYLIDCTTSQNLCNYLWIISDLDLSGRRFAKKNTNTLTGRMIYINNQIIKKYDKDCSYIKKWLPHLEHIPNNDLYNYPTIFDPEKRYIKYCNLFKNI